MTDHMARHKAAAPGGRHSTMQHMKYRPDIDGLRALAILPVLFYHVGSTLVSGGFIGVDVFFVISGYLITRTIRDEIDSNSFSIIAFYERRARRILPALFATIFTVFIVGALVLMPDEFRELGSRIVAVAFFASNILFWQQADYFAGPVELEPLVHTWSLAVEEQFYIVFPLLLLALSRFFKRRYFGPTLCLAIVSFLLSVAMMNIDRTGDYYLLPTRAWELLVGSLLAFDRLGTVKRGWFADALSAGGAALILASSMLLTKNSDFPGVNALWPVLGAAAILYANAGGRTVVGRVLGSKPFVAIGLISYSLYLVHWPIIVFFRYVLLRDFTAIEKVALISLMFALASLSWRFVERPFRNKHRVSRRQIFVGSGVVIALATICGLVIFLTDGVPQRFPKLASLVNEPRKQLPGPLCMMSGLKAEQWAGEDCYLTRGGGAPTTLLWGDSHASQYRNDFRQVRPELVPNLLMYATMGCIPVFDVNVSSRPACRASNDDVPNIIRAYGVKTVIMSGNWDYAMKSDHVSIAMLARTIDRLRALGVQVKIIGDNPFYPFANPKFLGYRLGQRPHPEEPFYMTPSNDWAVTPQIRELVQRSAFFDPMAMLCNKAKRECLVYEQGKLINKDVGHLSPYGSSKVMSQMRPFLASRAGKN
ncbi:acyltransferase family protein [Sphingomonas sp. PB4P5]|uniref:acyltransferase family protein n=1 Tax=Parasphingomonas puruogangriensis TaxID=3096155 RepID=UPI002FCC0611